MHIYALDIEQTKPKLRDLTPYKKSALQILSISEDRSEIIIADNHRNNKYFDVNKIDIVSGKRTSLAVNPGDIAQWIVDRQGNLIARIRQFGEIQTLQVKLYASSKDWISTAEWSIFDRCSILEISDDKKWAWALSNRGRDKIALVKFTLNTGSETVIYAEPDVDLMNVWIGPKSHAPLMAYSEPDYPKNNIFDVHLRDAMTNLTDSKSAMLTFNSADDNERRFTVSVSTDQGTKFYFFDAGTNKSILLGEDKLSRMDRTLATVKPISFKSRDGLDLHGYITLPAGVKPEKLPMVIMVHGGPWFVRDTWAQHDVVDTQFLANRGYAVLRVNYRGSSGYGRTFQEKSIGEIAGKMQEDLIDGVSWAVKTGVADPQKVAIFGASYGGYASLIGLTKTPEIFACGIDFVGPSDLVRLLEDYPEYGEFGKPWWYHYVGNPSSPKDRKIMESESPLNRAGNVTKPVLIMHGATDPLVKLSQSADMVAALKKAGKKVDFVVFAEDGHGNQKWSNNITLYRKTEDFLADCLGGRSNGFELEQLYSWMF